MKFDDLITRAIEKKDKNLRSSSFSYRIDEDLFYSYNEKIAYIDRGSNTMFIYGLTAKYDNFFSNTTSRHFSKLLNYCNENDIDSEILI
tara:strand:+ start:631 stop:897 length:267 start_codon:yes stop_codon:yes gene_type:complete